MRWTQDAKSIGKPFILEEFGAARVSINDTNKTTGCLCVVLIEQAHL